MFKRDPELSFQMAVDDYRRPCYSRQVDRKPHEVHPYAQRAHQRVEVLGGNRAEGLCRAHQHIHQGLERHDHWAVQNLQGLTKGSLRDNTTSLELALNTLAEAATTEISRHRNPQTMAENKQVAQSGGNAAKLARKDIERQIGHSIILPQKASDYLLVGDDGEGGKGGAKMNLGKKNLDSGSVCTTFATSEEAYSPLQGWPSMERGLRIDAAR